MNIWPPPPQRPEPQKPKQETIGYPQPPKTLAAVTVGIPVGLLSGIAVSVIIGLAKRVLSRHYPYFTANGSLYLLAIPIEIGTGLVIFPKNKAYALSFTLTAVCTSIVLGAIGTILDSFPELD